MQRGCAQGIVQRYQMMLLVRVRAKGSGCAAFLSGLAGGRRSGEVELGLQRVQALFDAAHRRCLAPDLPLVGGRRRGGVLQPGGGRSRQVCRGFVKHALDLLAVGGEGRTNSRRRLASGHTTTGTL